MAKVTLTCNECRSRNYRIAKSTKLERLTLNKFCRLCKKKTTHKEEK